MTPANVAADRDQADYERAVGLLHGGVVQQGAHLLGEIAKRTPDGQRRSQCFHSLAQVLEQLGRPLEAYQIWYDLAHKPPEQRNRFDLSARMQIMRVFDAVGLRVRPPDFPPRVQIEVTNRCNLRCVMCTRNQMQRPLGDLSFEHFKRLADGCSSEPGAVILLFFLGEPLLHPQLEEMVAYLDSVKDRSPIPLSFGVQTNGMLLSKERAGRLIDAGLRRFHFSVDGLEGDLERIRPGAEYPVVERNILNLLALRQELGLTDMLVEISKLCDDRNADEVQRFRQRWESKVDQLHLMGITKVAGNSYLDADGNLQRVEAAAPAAGRRYCGQGQRLLVFSNGDYGFCHGDVSGAIRLGNVEQRSIREVWNSPEINRVREQILAARYEGLPVCDGCPQSRA